MPYIKAARRLELTKALLLYSSMSPGDLNYLITAKILMRDPSDVTTSYIYNLCVNYFEAHQNYQGINDVMGALDCARRELTRRGWEGLKSYIFVIPLRRIGNQFYDAYAAPYEDMKIIENRDVYD